MSAELANARAFDDALMKLSERRPDAPFFKLPQKEKPALTRARMARFLQDRVAANGSVSRDDLEAAGFEGDEIDQLFHQAKRIAGLVRMVV
jgi:hypothetical protein